MPTFGRTEGEGTVIGTHVKLTGALSDPNDIIILGKLDGEIHSDRTVTIGPQAQVKGPVSAARVIVAGKVRGNIQTQDRLEIVTRGDVAGNIETRDLVIHSGAIFNGRCQVLGAEEEKAEEEDKTPKQQEPKVETRDVLTEEQPARRLWPPIRLTRFSPRENHSSGKTGAKEADTHKPPKTGQDDKKPNYEVE